MKIDPDSAQVRFPPPFVFLGFLLIGFGAGRWIALRTIGIEPPWGWIAGAILFVAGLATGLPAMQLFKRAGTPPPPWQPTTEIVTGGIYERTRNPMYIGMGLLYAGLAIGLDGPIALLLLPVVMLIIRYGVIAREERYLEAKFGEDYRSYKARVRRWF